MNIERSVFRTWLQGKPGNEVVGESRNGCSCPAANYIKTLPGIKFEHIDDRDLYIESQIVGSDTTYSKREPIPPWMGMFIKHIDSLDHVSISVTASAALYCLDETPQTLGELIAERKVSSYDDPIVAAMQQDMINDGDY